MSVGWVSLDGVRIAARSFADIVEVSSFGARKSRLKCSHFRRPRIRPGSAPDSPYNKRVCLFQEEVASMDDVTPPNLMLILESSVFALALNDTTYFSP